MIPNSVDVATRISPNLAALIESRVNDPDSDEPPTLGSVRSFVAGLVPPSLSETEHLHHFDIDA